MRRGQLLRRISNADTWRLTLTTRHSRHMTSSWLSLDGNETSFEANGSQSTVARVKKQIIRCRHGRYILNPSYLCQKQREALFDAHFCNTDNKNNRCFRLKARLPPGQDAGREFSAGAGCSFLWKPLPSQFWSWGSCRLEGGGPDGWRQWHPPDHRESDA